MNYAHDPSHPLATAFPYFPPEEQQWLQEQLIEILNGQLSMGSRVAEFEREFARLCNVPHAVAFPSCTSAMEAALVALGVGPGDEVLVPVETFVATGMVVSLVGATPIFTQVSPATFCMDFEDAEKRITSRTKGVIVVHFGGLIAPELPAFVDRMHQLGKFVIEDAAHAPGAELDGKMAGSFGDAGCFSFYPTKVITTGEGGMLTTSTSSLAQTARSLQSRGRDMDNPLESYIERGRNNRFTEIAAAMGLSQLRCLPDFLGARRRVAEVYDELLLQSELFMPVLPGEGSRPSYWRYVAVPTLDIDRMELKQRLAADRISIDWAYDPPLHLQPVFKKMLGTSEGMLPESEKLLAKHICLPVHARMRDIDCEFVVERVLHHARSLAKVSV